MLHCKILDYCARSVPNERLVDGRERVCRENMGKDVVGCSLLFDPFNRLPIV
jgi:hypothetical protein